jgi:hypothetical protein
MLRRKLVLSLGDSTADSFPPAYTFGIGWVIHVKKMEVNRILRCVLSVGLSISQECVSHMIPYFINSTAVGLFDNHLLPLTLFRRYFHRVCPGHEKCVRRVKSVLKMSDAGVSHVIAGLTNIAHDCRARLS